MRQVNFFIIFLLCLALVLFSMENTEPVVIKIVKGVEVQAPLAIELIFTMGVGAFLAWIFSVWTRFLRHLQSRQVLREIRSKDERIQELEQDVERYKGEKDAIEAEEPSSVLSESEAVTQGAMADS